MANENTSGLKGLFIVLVVVLIAVGGYALLSAPDNRSTSERVGDAAEEAARGNFGDAAGQLQDRSAAERAGDALKDAGNEIQERTE
jgi:hypothetical protein